MLRDTLSSRARRKQQPAGATICLTQIALKFQFTGRNRNSLFMNGHSWILWLLHTGG